MRQLDVTVRWLKPTRLRVYPIAIAGLTLLAWLASLRMGRGLVDAANHVVGPDFLIFYTAGRFFLDGRLNELYDFRAQQAFQNALLAPVHLDSVAAFVYPPIMAAIGAPFAVRGYLVGLLAWWAAGLLALVAAVWIFRLERSVLAMSTRSLLFKCCLFYPTLVWFLFGQNSAFTLLLYVLVYVLLRRRREFIAGLVLGCLLYKPQLAIGWGIMLLVQRRWHALLGAAVTTGIGIGICIGISPVATMVFWRLSALQMQLALTNGWGEQSLSFLALLIFSNVWPIGASVLGMALTLGAAALLASWWWKAPWYPGHRDWELRLAATIVIGLLISPHLYFYDLMLLLLPIGIVLSHYPVGTGGRPLDSGPVLAWTAWLYVTTFFSSYLTLAQLKLSAAVHLPAMAVQVSVPILLGWAIVVFRRAKTAEQATVAPWRARAAEAVAI